MVSASESESMMIDEVARLVALLLHDDGFRSITSARNAAEGCGALASIYLRPGQIIRR